MARRSGTSRTPQAESRSNPEAGFTLVEVLVALTVVTVLTAVAMGAIGAATRALAHGSEEARWTRSLALFDRAVRTAFSRFPPAFWGRAPVLEETSGGYRIRDLSDASGYSVSFRFVDLPDGTRGPGGRALVVGFGSAKVAVEGVRRIEFSPLRSGDGRLAGYHIEIGGAGERVGKFVVDFGGQYL